MSTNKDKIRAAAQKYLQKGQLDKAIREFERLLEDDPNDVRTLLKIGDLQVRKGDQPAATKTYGNVAKYYSDQGFFLKAVAVYKQILKLDPSLLEVSIKLAELYHQLGLASDAVTQFRQICDLYEKAEKFEEAASVVKKMVDLDPEGLPSRLKLAELHLKLGRNDEAKEGLHRVANQLLQANRPEEYLKVAERLFHIDPEDAVTARELARLYMERNDPRKALSKLQVCFHKDPKDETVLTWLGRAFNDLGQGPKAIAAYRELAAVQRDAGKSDAWHATLREILVIDPQDAEARSALNPGGAQSPSRQAPTPPARVQQVIEAVELPEDSMELLAAEPLDEDEIQGADVIEELAPEPLNDEAIRKLLIEVDIYIKYGLRNKAVEHLETILASKPDSRDALERLKGVMLDADDSQGAADILLRMAQHSVTEGNEDQARNDIEELLGVDPESAGARALMKQLRGGSMPSNLAPHADPHDGGISVEIEAPENHQDEGVSFDSDVSIEVETEAPPPGITYHPSASAASLNLDEGEGSLDELPVEAEAHREDMFEMPGSLSVAGHDDETSDLSPEDGPGVSVDFELPATASQPEGESLSFTDDMLDAPVAPVAKPATATKSTSPSVPKSAPAVPAAKAPASPAAKSSAPASPVAAKAAVAEAAEAPASAVAAKAPTSPAAKAGAPAAPAAAATKASAPASPATAKGVPASPVAAKTSAPASPEVKKTPPRGSTPTLELDIDALVGDAVPTSAPRAPASPATKPASVTAVAQTPTRAPASPVAKPVAKAPVPEPEFELPAFANETENQEAQAPGLEVEMPAFETEAPAVAQTTTLDADVEIPAFVTDGPSFEAPAFEAPAFEAPAPEVETPVAKPAPVAAKPAPVVAKPAAVAAKPAAVAAKPAATPAPATKPVAKAAPPPPEPEPEMPEESSEADLSDELEEVQFFLQQGLEDEAREALDNLANFYPTHPGVLALHAQLSGDEDSSALAAVAEPLLQHDPAKVEAALAEELASVPEPEDDGQISFDDVFDQFKKGVEKQVDATDFDTHFNLGIAYKEMGLLDDAIREFQLTATAPGYEINALTMVGLCQLQRNEVHEALEAFMQGLASPRVTAREVIALRYEIGLAYESMGHYADAAKFYEKANAMDPTFRDVTARLTEVQSHTNDGPEASNGELDALLGDAPMRKNDKISYL